MQKYTEAIQLSGSDAEFFLKRAAAYMKLGQFERKYSLHLYICTKVMSHLFESYFGGPPNSFDLQRQLQMGPRLSTYSQKTAKPMQEKGKRIIINLKQRKLKIELVQKILNQEKI